MRFSTLSQLARKFSVTSSNDRVSRRRSPGSTARRRRPVLETLEARLALDAAADEGSSGSTTDPTLLTLVVSTTVDEVDGDHSAGDLSLREAVILANAHSGNTTIELPAGVYRLTIPRPSLNWPDASGPEDGGLQIVREFGSIRIVGQGAANTIIDGNGLDSVISFGHGDNQLLGVTIRGGDASAIDTDPFGETYLRGVGGGIYVGGRLHIENSVIEANHAPGSGGGIFADESSALTMIDTIVRGNSAKFGGGAWLEEDANVIIHRSQFTNNSASEAGGGLYLREPIVDLIDSTIANNFAGQTGGGIHVDRAFLNIQSTNIAENVASSLGGGVFLKSDFPVSIADSTISANRTGELGSGGGLYIEYSESTTITNTTISDNEAGSDGGSGGGIYASGEVPFEFESELTIIGGTIEGNSASTGGGVAIAQVNVSISGTSFTGNSATVAGGGLLTTNLTTELPATPSITLDNVQLVGNTAAYGAGLCNGNNQSLALTNSLIADNTATQQGGGAVNDGGYLHLVNTDVRANRVVHVGESGLKSSALGGGILNVSSTSDATLVLEGSQVRDNELEVHGRRGVFAGGGGIANQVGGTGSSARLEIRDTVVSGNLALATNVGHSLADDYTVEANGGGMFSSGGSESAMASVVIERSSLVDNRAEAIADALPMFHILGTDAAGGGGYTGFYSRMVVEDSTVARNTVRAVDLQPGGERAEAFGGGLASRRIGSALVVSNSTVSENTVVAESDNEPIAQGGGIYSDRKDLTVTGSSIVSNDAGDQGSGGGLFVSGGTITASTITSNAAANGGGVTVDWNVSAVISDTVIFANTATVAGGGLLTTNLTTALPATPSITLDNVQLVGNTAAYGAGLCNGNNQSLGLTNSLIADNTATQQGGGAINDGGYLRLEDSEVRGNLVLVEQGTNVTAIGGGIFNRSLAGATASAATLVLDGVDIVGNELRVVGDDFANAYGAGVAMLADASAGGGEAAIAVAFLMNSRISGNTAWAKTAASSSVEEPFAQAFGGGFYSSSKGPTATADVHVVNSTIDGNAAIATADESLNYDGSPYAVGGGVFSDASGLFSVVGTTVSSNTAFSDLPFDDNAKAAAGGIAFAPASPDAVLRVVQSTISGNLARARSSDDAVANGGGIVVGLPFETRFQGQAEFVSSTIAYNRVTTEAPDNVTARASGVDVFAIPGSVVLYQTLVAANVVAQTKTGLPDGDQTTMPAGRSTRGDIVDGGFNWIVEQEATSWLDTLAYNGGPTQTHALLPGSPAIDAGDPAFDPNVFTPPLSTDQRGQPRVLDGNNDASPRIDIGAYELSPTFLFGDLNGDGVVGLGDLIALQRNLAATDATYAQGDLNADGHVDRADVGALAQHFGRRLPPIASPSASAAVVARVATRSAATPRPADNAGDNTRQVSREVRRRALSADSVDRAVASTTIDAASQSTTAKLRARRRSIDVDLR